jgi:indolepyruvate ferredoxin oxidoreductase
VDAFDATALALQLCGDTIAANLFMLGVAFQKGLIPVGSNAIKQAIRLNGAAAEMNLTAFHGGRQYAINEGGHLKGSSASLDYRRKSLSLAEQVTRRVEFLTEYQSQKYAARFQALVNRTASFEADLTPGASVLTETVANTFFKLLAYKDEYEIGRLYSSESFKAQLDEVFESRSKIAFNLAPPIFSRKSSDGRPKKREFGSWMIPVFALLAKLKFLRGTIFDPFGRTEERKIERQLIEEFETLMLKLLDEANRSKINLLVEIAAAPQKIRGFGPVKLAAVDVFRTESAFLLARWHDPEFSPQSVEVSNAAMAET